MTGITSGGGGGYDYVEPVYPSDPDEGESLYQTEENRAFVYNGSAWVEQTVTAHSQLSGVGPDTHHSQTHGNEDHTETYETESGAQNRADSAESTAKNYADGEIESHRQNETHDQPQPAENHGNEDHTATFETESGAQSRVDSHAADANAHHAVFEPSDYTPESDTHSRYTDSEAANAAPVQEVNGETGNVYLSADNRTVTKERVKIAGWSNGDSGNYIGQNLSEVWAACEPGGTLDVTVEDPNGNTLSSFTVDGPISARYYNNKSIGTVSWSTSGTSQVIWGVKYHSHSHNIQ